MGSSYPSTPVISFLSLAVSPRHALATLHASRDSLLKKEIFLLGQAERVRNNHSVDSGVFALVRVVIHVQ